MDLDLRLIKRHTQLVRSHMIQSDLLSSGTKSSLKSNAAFSETQAAWRFYNNKNCDRKELMKPILAHGVAQSALCENYVLVPHDWSGLSYKKHTSKDDRYGIHNETELGYELQSSLMLSDVHGGPIAPVAFNVLNKADVLSTYTSEGERSATHLEELAKRIEYLEGCDFKKPLVHIIDREGDSVQLMRTLADKSWLVRCRSNSNVVHENASIRVDKLAQQMEYTHARIIDYKGRKAEQFIAELEVSVTRAAHAKKAVNGKRQKIPGDAVPCRLVVSKVLDDKGRVLAYWYLLTNVKPTVEKTTIALWYYWRWGIESFFKLLKSAGMQLESWQQETAEAITCRLLVACMACVLVWQIAEATGPEAQELRVILIRLSGKQMKYKVAFTKPALFTGLCSLLNALDLLEKYDPVELKQMLQAALGALGEAFV